MKHVRGLREKGYTYGTLAKAWLPQIILENFAAGEGVAYPPGPRGLDAGRLLSDS